MRNSADDAGARRWLVGPPQEHEFAFELSSGGDAEVTPEVRAAIEGMLQALGTNQETDDVEGYTCFGYVHGCPTNKFICMPRASCDFEGQRQCFTDYHCTVAPIAS